VVGIGVEAVAAILPLTLQALVQVQVAHRM
jgi:hypothetical protein